MKLTIRSLSSKPFDSELSALTIPGVNGEIEILPGHAKAFFVLKKGKIQAKGTSGRKKTIQVTDGICWVDTDVTVLYNPDLDSSNR